MSADPTIVLASASPRRRDVLETLGLAFDVVPAPEGTETAWEPGVPPADFARDTAVAKRDAVTALRSDAIVIAADTIVEVEDRVLGKPVDRDDARRMLDALSAREHVVRTGLAIARPGATAEGLETTHVRFRALVADEIEHYVTTGEPLDKAGAYGIQGYGATLVTSVSGCYYTVMGLPVALLLRLLDEIGWEYRAPGRLRPKAVLD